MSKKQSRPVTPIETEISRVSSRINSPTLTHSSSGARKVTDDVSESSQSESYYKSLAFLQRTLDENAELVKKIRTLESQIVPCQPLPSRPKAIQSETTAIGANIQYFPLDSSTKIQEERKMMIKLEQENRDIRRELAIALQMAEEARSDVFELKKKLHKIEIESQAKFEEELRSVRQQQKKEIHELLTKIQNMERATSEERRKLQEDLDQYSLKYDVLKSGNVDIRLEAKKTKEEKNRLEENLEKYKLENEILIRKINQLTLQNMQLTEYISGFVVEIRTIQIEQLNQEIKTLKQKLRERTAAALNQVNEGDFTQLLKDKKALEQRNASMQKKLDQRDNKYGQYENEISVLKKEIELYKAADSETHTKIGNLVSQVDMLSNELKRTYQTLREMATVQSLPYNTRRTDSHEPDRQPEDVTQRGKPVAYSDYIQVRRENALLKAQLSELNRMQVTSHTAHHSIPTTASGFGVPFINTSTTQSNVATRGVSPVIREIEDVTQSLPEIMRPSSVAQPSSALANRTSKLA